MFLIPFLLYFGRYPSRALYYEHDIFTDYSIMTDMAMGWLDGMDTKTFWLRISEFDRMPDSWQGIEKQASKRGVWT